MLTYKKDDTSKFQVTEILFAFHSGVSLFNIFKSRFNSHGSGERLRKFRITESVTFRYFLYLWCLKVAVLLLQIFANTSMSCFWSKEVLTELTAFFSFIKAIHTFFFNYIIFYQLLIKLIKNMTVINGWDIRCRIQLLIKVDITELRSDSIFV